MQQERDLVVAAAVLDLVVIIEHQGNRRGERGQLVEKDGEHRSSHVLGRRPKGRQDGITVDLRASSLQGAHDMPPQTAGVIIVAIQRNPGEPPALAHAGTPLRDQSRLAGPRGRGHEHQPGRGARQVASQRSPLHPFPVATWADGAWSPAARPGPRGAATTAAAMAAATLEQCTDHGRAAARPRRTPHAPVILTDHRAFAGTARRLVPDPAVTGWGCRRPCEGDTPHSGNDLREGAGPRPAGWPQSVMPRRACGRPTGGGSLPCCAKYRGWLPSAGRCWSAAA